MPIFSSTVNDLQSGASFRFDGINDVVTVADNDGIDLGSNSFTVSYWIKDSTVYATGVNGGFVSKFGGGIGWAIYSSYGNLTIFVDDGTTEQACHYYTNSWANGEWRNFVWSVDRTTNVIKMYLDGVETTISNSGSISGISDNTLSNSGNFLIGQDSFSTYKMKGEISSVRVHNRALTADEVVDAYNGQKLPYFLRGASQTNLIADNFSTYGTDDNSNAVNGWTAWGSNYSVSRNSNGYMQIVAAGGMPSNSALFYLNYAIPGADVEIGRRYRVEVDAWATGDAGIGLAFAAGAEVIEGTTSSSWVNSVYLHNGTVTTSSQTFYGEITITANTGNGPFFYVNGQGANSTVYIDNLKLIPVGCIAEFLPTGISADRWVDTSGNDLHGTVTGAIATNHKRGSLTTKNIKTTEMDFSGTPYSGTYLSSYEQGTWSPILKGTTSGTESTGTGTYTRIGNLVCVKVHYYKAITSGTLVGNVQLTGFPYAPMSNQSLGFLNIRCGDQSGSGGDYAAWGILGTNGILNLHPAGEMNYVNAYQNVAATYPAARLRQNSVSNVIFNWEITYLTAVTIQAI
jgi:hypothetical protein